MKSSLSLHLAVAGLCAFAFTLCLGVAVAWSQAQPARVVQPTAAQSYAPGIDHIFTPASSAGVYGYVQANPEGSQAAIAADRKTRELLAKYSSTEAQDDRAKLVELITTVVGEQFDARQEMRQQELKRLEEQLKKLRQLHDRRVSEKSQIIEDRVRQLLRDADGLGWGADENRAFFAVPAPGVPGVQVQGVPHVIER